MQHEDTRTAMAFAGLASYETWMHYCNMGGNTDFFEFDAYLHGLHPLELDDADTISQAVNELIDDTCPGESTHCRAPYSWRLPDIGSVTGEEPDEDRDDGFDDLYDLAFEPLDLPVDSPVKRFAEPRPRRIFGSRLLSGVDLRPVSGRPGVPLPPGAPAELLGDLLDGGLQGRVVRSDKQ